MIVQDQGLSKIIFSDVNPEVNITDTAELVFNEDAINASILTILNTKKGTRVFRRNFGSSLVDLVFLPMTPTMVQRVYREIISALEKWETRIIIDLAEVIPDYDNQQWFVEITYRIPSLANKQATFNFNLVRDKK